MSLVETGSYRRKIFDIEHLIWEVEKRPGLYNPESKNFDNRNVRQKLWEEVYETIIDNWNLMKVNERKLRANEVRKRWKGLRDCFRRELALRKKGNTKRRTYIYFDQMQFLLPVVQQTNEYKNRPKSFLPPNLKLSSLKESFYQNINSDNEDPLEEPTNIKSEEYETEIINVPEDVRNPHEDVRKLHEDVRKPYENVRKPQEDEFDDDKAFLMSLLPTIKRFPESEKLNVRVEIMNAIRKIQIEIMQQNQHQSTAEFVETTNGNVE